ncbi:MAG: AI-2E family transporter [Phenylobacterium sp.]|nr:AI-2E family transporter [Phenylobacterium sp.]
MALIVAATLGFLIWRLADVILLAFGAVLVAILLHALAEPLVQRARMGRQPALAVAVVVMGVAIAGTLWLFGQQIGQQMAALGELLPRTWAALQERLSASRVGAYVLDDLQRLRQPDGMIVTLGSQLIGQWASAATAAVIVLFAGLYLAFHPQTYVGGLLRLVPVGRRPRMAQVFDACGKALNRWLVGQLISMVLVGVTVGLGLWLAGVPSPFALGVVAGLGQFVPVVGPMAATVPGLIVAAGQDFQTLAWTGVVYLGASQFEANVVTPLVLRQMVELPMAVTLFAVLAMGVLLGPLGVLFATPLAVVAYVVVRMLYVEDVLGDTQEPAP